jgi:DNA-binding transcriptional MerR regulator
MDKSPDAFRTISEVAEDLDLPQHVLRFWETRFSQIRPLKRGGGRRYYRRDDVDLLRGIRHLLYGQGYTIRGVQRILKEQGVKTVQSLGRGETVAPPPDLRDAEGEAEAVVHAGGDAPSLFPEMDEGGEQRGFREGSRLSADDEHRLRSALADLMDCRRLLDGVRGVEVEA